MSARPEPDLDGLGGPLGGVGSAAGCVEARSEGGRGRVGDGATLVGELIGGVDIAVGSDELASETGVTVDAAARVGVKGHLIDGHVVDAFDDVDFTVVGPRLTCHPAASDSQQECSVEA